MFVPICLLVSISVAIWIGGPHLIWNHYNLLASAEKRIYAILSIILLWLLKFLIIDLANPPRRQEELTSKKMQGLQKRFKGAIQFLKKTSISKHSKPISLNKLPWFLLIGPSDAGKTTLLANSGVNFILQKQFQNQKINPSENCDWWVTKDISIIDVPGIYITPDQQEKSSRFALWRFFLHLIKKQRGKNSISGMIIALPLPELMKQKNNKKYHSYLQNLFRCIAEFHKVFPEHVPCHLIITKCDLIPGFSEYFAESGHDEVSQAFGITLPQAKEGEKINELFISRFNSLIKKLNQQLLWRLHEERNPMVRPYIKDFPLQIERVKEFTLDFIKKFYSTKLKLSLQSVHLTSAAQVTTSIEVNEQETNITEPIDITQRSIQIFKAPTPISRAYFIKQVITHGLASVQVVQPSSHRLHAWRNGALFVTSLSIIAVTAIILGTDFEQGVQKAYLIQNKISDYQLSIQTTHDPDEHLSRTLILLNNLQQVTKQSAFKTKLNHLLTFYSHQSNENANGVYHEALRTLLLPQIKNYFAEYLKIPVNRSTDHIYAVLKAYLMLGDSAHFKMDFVIKTMQEVLPRSLNDIQAKQLIGHVTETLNNVWRPLSLDQHIIRETRKYLTTLPNLQLAYVILKNISNNNDLQEVNLGTNVNSESIFQSKIINQIPTMFTVKSFSHILTQETIIAAEETLMGNWVIGNDFNINKNPTMTAALIEQLRIAYINNYIDLWESLLANIHLSTGDNLEQTDLIMIKLTNNDSPLLQLLKTLHENTYFEPIASYSPKLQNLGGLISKNSQSGNQLNQIFEGLQSMHKYVQTILTSKNQKKAAFNAVSKRMQNRGTDAITQIRLIAAKSPEPIKGWLEKIATDVWRLLMSDASHYIDTSWQTQVHRFYQTEIANRYPFSPDAKQEVELKKFIEFFGSPGTMVNFYNQYLQPFIDTSDQDWRWKILDESKLMSSDEILKQIQYAMLIHRTFFPNRDNKLYFQFALKPYKFSKQIQSVQLNIDDKQFIDHRNGFKIHLLEWPNNESKITSIQLTLADQRVINHSFPGDWGLFKLMKQSFEGAVTKKQMLINFSMNEYPAKYLLTTDSEINPFLSLNFNNFYLPKTIS